MKQDNQTNDNPQMLNSENSACETANTPSSSTSKNYNNSQKSPNSTKIPSNSTDNIQEIFNTFNERKVILKIAKFLGCIKHI